MFISSGLILTDGEVRAALFPQLSPLFGNEMLGALPWEMGSTSELLEAPESFMSSGVILAASEKIPEYHVCLCRFLHVIQPFCSSLILRRGPWCHRPAVSAGLSGCAESQAIVVKTDLSSDLSVSLVCAHL